MSSISSNYIYIYMIYTHYIISYPGKLFLFVWDIEHGGVFVETTLGIWDVRTQGSTAL